MSDVPTWTEEPDPYANRRYARRVVLDDARRVVAAWKRAHPGQHVPPRLTKRVEEAERQLEEVENRG